jgi:hypothetical protein
VTAGHEACMREKRGASSVLWRNLREKDHFEDLIIDRR